MPSRYLVLTRNFKARTGSNALTALWVILSSRQRHDGAPPSSPLSFQFPWPRLERAGQAGLQSRPSLDLGPPPARRQAIRQGHARRAPTSRARAASSAGTRRAEREPSIVRCRCIRGADGHQHVCNGPRSVNLTNRRCSITAPHTRPRTEPLGGDAHESAARREHFPHRIGTDFGTGLFRESHVRRGVQVLQFREGAIRADTSVVEPSSPSPLFFS